MDNNIQFLPIEDLIPQYEMAALSEATDWGLVMAGIPQAHKLTRGAGVTVAVLDTGGPDHFDLAGNLLPAQNASRADSARDSQGHGTHVAGIIAALENGVGVVGVAPEAKIVPIKVLDDNGRSGYDAIEKGIRMAIDAKVDVINMSLGAPMEPPAALHEVIKEAASKGIIIVAAAGNDSGAVNWPARYPEVIAVAAIDEDGNLASFSSHGDQIAVGAPGVNVYSTYLNNQYAILKGTSQAAPFVAGVCALILSWLRANPTMPQITGVQDMLQRLDDISDPQGRLGVPGKSGVLGYGIPHFCNDMPWVKKD